MTSVEDALHADILHAEAASLMAQQHYEEAIATLDQV